MEDNGFVLLATFYDKYQFEKVRDILNNAKIEFTAANRAPAVNFKVPGSAHTEIEIHVAEEDLEKAEALLVKEEN